MSPDRQFYEIQESSPGPEVAAWAAAMIPITEKENPKKGNGSWFYCEIEIGVRKFLGKLWVNPFGINGGTFYIPFGDSQGGVMEAFATRNKTLVEDVISGEEHFKIDDSDGSIAVFCSADDYDLVSVEMNDSAAGPLRYEPFKPVVMVFGVATRFEEAFPGSKIRPLSPEEIRQIL